MRELIRRSKRSIMSSLSSSHPLLAHPPSLSFNGSTQTSTKDEANEIKTKFTAAINAIKKQPSFTSLSHAFGDASAASARVTLPSMVHDNAKVRTASNKMKDELKNMFDATLSDAELYTCLQNIEEGSDDNHNEEDVRFKENILRIMHRNGCGLSSSSDQSTIETKRMKIEETCTAFCAAINENDSYLLFTDEELNGLDDLERFPREEFSCKIKIGLKAPSTLPVLKFAKSSMIRRNLYEAISTKCQKVNTPRFLEVLKLRDECAKLLGYDHHAHYMCDVKMVGTAQKAEEFLLELAEAYEPTCKQELQILVDLKNREIGNTSDYDAILDPWDVAYYTRMYKAEAGVDEQALRKYFPLEHVKTTILSIYEELLGLKFEHVLDAEVWHEDVKCYAVRSASDNSVLGHFYLDIFPRKGKYSHQCVYPLQPSYQTDKGRRVLPACVNIGNLTPSKEGAPSLLLFREVETFFHEVSDHDICMLMGIPQFVCSSYLLYCVFLIY